MHKLITEKDYDLRAKEKPAEHWIQKYFFPKEPEKKKRIKEVMAALAIKHGEKILDVGCGFGPFILLAEKENAKCIGIDYSLETLKKGMQIFKILRKIGKEPSFALASATRLPFKNNCFDKILNVDFLEHIYAEEKNAVFREMSRVLRKGGIVVSYTPNRKRLKLDYFLKKIVLALQGKRLGWQYEDKKTALFDTDLHVGLSTASELKEAFEKNCFSVKKIAFVETSVPLLGRFFPGIAFHGDLFGAYLLVVAEKNK